METSNITYSIYALIIIIFAGGCDSLGTKYLDRKPTNKQTSEQVFSQYNSVNKLVNDLYNNMKYANRPLKYLYDFAMTPATDAEEGSTVGGNQTNRFNSGSYSPSGIPLTNEDNWAGLYNAIRKANVILEGVKKYNTPDDPLNPGNLKKRMGEVYFIRGYLHWLLVRNYGEAKYMDHKANLGEKSHYKRQSVDTLIADIIADADSAFSRVPARWTGKDFGRIDKGACLGLKAVARWTAAEPLWNGGELPNDTRVHKSDYKYKNSRWVKAKKAAKAVLDFKINGQKRYTLYSKHDRTEFENDLGRNENNSKVYTRLWDMFYDMDAFKNEGVLFVTRNTYHAWQGDQYPPSAGGSARQQPTQEQVDQYGCMSSDGYGYPIWSKQAKKAGYNDANPYTSCKRDPRFYRDIIYDGATFQGKVINTATGADKIGASNSTKTGYFLRKFLKEGWNHNYTFYINGPPIWRLPQFIYMYAEAVNRLSGPNRKIYNLINKVRRRSFMAPEPLSIMNSKKAMRLAIRREWRVELYHENHRYWHLRLEMQPTTDRTKRQEKAYEASGSTPAQRSQNYWPYPQTQTRIHGMKPVQDPNGKIIIGGTNYKMQRFLVEKRFFSPPKSYLFPLLQGTLARDPSLIQNPGW